MNHLKTITLVATLAACSNSPKDTGDTGATGPTPAASTSAGGCDWMGSFCYDFDGPAWDAASAEAGCDAFTDAAVSEGAPIRRRRPVHRLFLRPHRSGNRVYAVLLRRNDSSRVSSRLHRWRGHVDRPVGQVQSEDQHIE